MSWFAGDLKVKAVLPPSTSDRFDECCGVDVFEVEVCGCEVFVAELLLDQIQGEAFLGEFGGVGVS